ncbi:MAG: ribosomal RNA small subunit methyltransferase A [Candidatus Moranbacteria bacterium]|nr:ribosomal RNA small subunit methyltransferase A [Candidatus Moranbacteria bacterium]
MQVEQIKQELKKIQARPLKNLGQNFLICPEVLNKIVSSSNLDSNDQVLEIGPGLGILTDKLIKKTQSVLAIEYDKKYYKYLSEKYKDRSLQLIQKDFLKINPDSVLENFFQLSAPGGIDYKVIANLPYNISKKILRNFLQITHRPQTMTFLLQKEVGKKICATPPKMNFLALLMQFFYDVEFVQTVKKQCFYPVPKVDSGIIRFYNLKKQLDYQDPRIQNLFKLIKIGFASPRKTLINNLGAVSKIYQQKAKFFLNKSNKSLTSRAQELNLKDWETFYELVEKS